MAKMKESPRLAVGGPFIRIACGSRDHLLSGEFGELRFLSWECLEPFSFLHGVDS